MARGRSVSRSAKTGRFVTTKHAARSPKTTTTERILYYTGINYKLGEVHDGAATLTGGNPSAWPSAASPMGALEILGGTAACAAALFMISRSSLGAFVVGALSTVIGLPFILMPGVTKSILGPTVNRLQAHSDLGKALSTYVMDDGLSGRFILMGVLTIMVAVVGHMARRSGQRAQDDGRGPRD